MEFRLWLMILRFVFFEHDPDRGQQVRSNLSRLLHRYLAYVAQFAISWACGLVPTVHIGALWALLLPACVAVALTDLVGLHLANLLIINVLHSLYLLGEGFGLALGILHAESRVEEIFQVGVVLQRFEAQPI